MATCQTSRRSTFDDWKDLILSKRHKLDELDKKLEKAEARSSEEDKKEEDNISGLKNEINVLAEEIDVLDSNSNRALLRQANKTDDYPDEKDKTIEDLGKEIQEHTKQIEKQNNEIQELKDEVEKLKIRLAAYEIEVKRSRQNETISEEKKAMLYLGEMCHQIPSLMYQQVLPDHHVEMQGYKVKRIEEDIDDLLKSKKKKRSAKKRWNYLKNKLKWHPNLEKTLRALKNSRNREAHPNLKRTPKSQLRQYAKVLKEKGGLRGWMSIKRVNKLIDVWVRLVAGTD